MCCKIQFDRKYWNFLRTKCGGRELWQPEPGQWEAATSAEASFSSEKISDFDIVALSFVCDKYYLIMD